ncbi:carboxypeptidase-like regulatory domain-containing protein [Granulosicoccaceae sp. 1_MG-2023]|nr:carboxypeptidase-like regulatory domain-containing protein [Granulosicoccaceae sp. 1_MG-2023]
MKFAQRLFRSGPRLAVLLGVVIGIVAISQAEAADYGVRVMDEQGRPLADAAVCVGTSARHDQFGVMMTDENGVAMVHDVPAVELKVIVSRSGYQGVALTEPVRNWNLIKGVKLLADGIGPRCDAAGLLEKEINQASLSVRSLYGSRSRDSYIIEAEIDGAPSHYRVSTSPDFSDAKWLPYERRFSYTPGQAEALYYQVRRVAGNKNSWLEARSPVVTLQVN